MMNLPKQLTLEQAAAVLGLKESTLRSMAVQGEIDAIPRGDSFVFQHTVIELWLSTHFIDGSLKQDKSHSRWEKDEPPKLSELCPRQCVSCSLPGTSRATILKSLTELADQSGFLYDPEDFKTELTKREEAGTTNIGNGVAIPHTLIRDEGYFSETFICLAKLARPSYFNSAPDGSITELLIASCSMDTKEHLNILKQIARLCKNPDFMKNVRLAETDDELYEALVQAETLPAK